MTDIDAPYQTAGVSYSEKITKTTAKRLRRTRQHLGSYRHDLLVAMRVVNNVEREMMRAEYVLRLCTFQVLAFGTTNTKKKNTDTKIYRWENWLLDENTRCKQVGAILQEANRTSTTNGKKTKESQQVIDSRNGRMNDLRRWHEDYCGSCKLEQDLLVEGRKHLAFG